MTDGPGTLHNKSYGDFRTDGRAWAGAITSFSPTTISAEYWVKFNSFPDPQEMYMSFLGNEADFVPFMDIHFWPNDNSAMDPQFLGSNYHNDAVQLTANTWQHVVLVFDSNTDKLDAYLNNVQVRDDMAGNRVGGSDGLPFGSFFDRFSLGSSVYGATSAQSPATSTAMDGLIAIARIYDFALTPAQVQDNYLDGLAAVPEPSSWVLLIAGSLLLVGRRSKRRQ